MLGIWELCLAKGETESEKRSWTLFVPSLVKYKLPEYDDFLKPRLTFKVEPILSADHMEGPIEIGRNKSYNVPEVNKGFFNSILTQISDKLSVFKSHVLQLALG